MLWLCTAPRAAAAVVARGLLPGLAMVPAARLADILLWERAPGGSGFRDQTLVLGLSKGRCRGGDPAAGGTRNAEG